jgi:peroxiredoxin
MKTTFLIAVPIVLLFFISSCSGEKNSQTGFDTTRKETEAPVNLNIGLQIGQQAPDVSLPDVKGNVVPLSSLRGKYVLLDFWASWCGPCRMENPNVVRMYQKYKSKGFEVYSVSLDNNKANWEAAIARDQLTWTHVSDLKMWNSVVVTLYQIDGIPLTFLLDPDGKIVDKNLRGPDLEKKLGAIFGE